MNQIQRKPRTAPNNIAWKLLGSAAIVVAVAGLIISLPDLKRYIKISTM